MNQPKIEDNIFQTAMRELSAMEMKEEVLLTISKLLLTRLAIFFLSSQNDLVAGADWEKAGREHTLQSERGFSLFSNDFFFCLK